MHNQALDFIKTFPKGLFCWFIFIKKKSSMHDMWSLICVYDTGQSNIGEWQNHGIDHLIRQLIGQAENINILHMLRKRLQWSCNAMAMAFSLRIYHCTIINRHFNTVSPPEIRRLICKDMIFNDRCLKELCKPNCCQ